MNIQLKNATSTMVISTLGAEPQSLVRNGIEYIWNGDKEYWFRRAPLLFPMTGPTKDDSIEVDGKKYKMPGNGFARDTEFTLISKSDKEVTLRLEESEKTLCYYPFPFSLTVTYTLLENGYTAKAEIEAKDEDIYFTFGWHPAFSLDINGKGCDLSTYSLSFDQNEEADRRYQVNNVFQVEKNFLVGDTIELSRKETDKGPIALWNIKSDEVTLTSTEGEHGVTAHMGTMHTFVSWTCAPKHAQYICLEPMYSFGDASRPVDIKKMDGIIKLEKGKKQIFENTFNVF